MSGQTVIPFGKYRGQEIQQIMARDPQYVQWLLQQTWFSEKFSPIYQLVVNNFAQPSEETPEHNAIQVDFQFRCAFWDVINLKINWSRLTKEFRKSFPNGEFETHTAIGDASFEDFSDIWFPAVAKVHGSNDSLVDEWFYIAVEIKPSMGDDYPAVLRQIKRQQVAAKTENEYSFYSKLHWFLLVDQFGSRAVTLEQVKQIFEREHIGIVTMAEIREQLVLREQREIK